MSAAPDDLDALLLSLLAPAEQAPEPVAEAASAPVVATPEPPELDLAAEMAAAQAWRDGRTEAFQQALARLPEDRADHHRRMASVCNLIKSRQAERARLKGEVRGRTPPAAVVGFP